MRRVEDRVRDNLSENLNVLESGLKLIKKEFHLPNLYGSKGFIDILATDYNDHYVIIEIKRSEASARETLHEIIKYAALLKQKYKVKDSEIRIIILSTTWRELLVPISKLINDTFYNIECYQINLDKNYKIVSKSIIELEEQEEIRSLSPKQLGFYCKDKDTLIKLQKLLVKVIFELKIKNAVIIEMSTESIKFPNKFCLYFAMNRESNKLYCDLIHEIDKEKGTNYMEIIDEYTEGEIITDDESLTYYLEDQVLKEVIDTLYQSKTLNSFMELGSPQGFAKSMDYWKVDNILRFGFYKEDKRLKDYQIMKEIMGLDGVNEYLLFESLEIKFRAKMKEVLENIEQFLDDNSFWKQEIIKVLNKYRGISCKATITIFKPKRILESLYFLGSKNIFSFPFYEIIVETLEDEKTKLKIYRGDIGWNGKEVDFNLMLKRYFYNSSINLFLFTDSLNNQLEEFLGIEYLTNTYEYIENEFLMTESSSNSAKTIADFCIKNRNFIDELKKLYDKIAVFV